LLLSFRNVDSVRVALVFAGKLGTFSGRISEDTSKHKVFSSKPVPEDVFNICMFCWKGILDKDVDNQTIATFLHSWDYAFASRMQDELKPSRSMWEDQISFTYPATPLKSYTTTDSASKKSSIAVPELKKEDIRRCGGQPCPTQPEIFPTSLLSQWFSRLRALELVLQYEKENDMLFDLVHITRFDFCICQEKLQYGPFLTPGKILYVPLPYLTWRRGTNKHIRKPPNVPLLESIEGKVPRDGSLVDGGFKFDIPRFGDQHILGSSEAVHRLTLGMVQNSWNQSINMGIPDSHAVLSAMMSRLFNVLEIEYEMRILTSPAAAVHARKEGAVNVSEPPYTSYGRATARLDQAMALVHIRNEMKLCRTNFTDPKSCFNHYCAPDFPDKDQGNLGLKKSKPM